jgi:hypothetical protein
MTNAELVERVRIIGRNVGNNEISNQQLLKHVNPDVAGLKNFPGGSAFGANIFESRGDKFLFDRIEVDAFTGTEGSDYECSHAVVSF